MKKTQSLLDRDAETSLWEQVPSDNIIIIIITISMILEIDHNTSQRPNCFYTRIFRGGSKWRQRTWPSLPAHGLSEVAEACWGSLKGR